MKRRRVLWLATGLAQLAGQRTARAQASAPMRRVGILSAGSPNATGALWDSFKQGIAELGWREGRNVEYLFAYAYGDLNQFDSLASQLVAQRAELIVVSTSEATRAAHKAAPALPIVMTSVGSVVENGFVNSLTHPGGRITGLTNQVQELRAKMVEVLHEFVPTARRIAVLLGANAISASSAWIDTERACAVLGLQALRFGANDPTQIASAVEKIVRQRCDAVGVPTDGMYTNERVRLQALFQAARLPAAYQYREHVLAGGLVSYGPSLSANLRYAAKFVDKILKGAKPGDLPVEQPTLFHLVINLKTAKALGLNVPKALLIRADELIE